MKNSFKRFLDIVTTPGRSRTVGLFALVLILAAIPLTVFIAQQQQEVRQRAQECDPNECVEYGNPECDENGENCGDPPCLKKRECPEQEPTQEPADCSFEFKYNECTGCETSRPVYQNCKGEYDTGPEKSDSECKSECSDPSDPDCPFKYLRNECTGCETSQPIYQNCRGEFDRGPEKSDSACKNECAQDPNCPFVYKYNECTGCETSQPVYQNCKGEFDRGPERSDSACKNECSNIGGQNPQPNCGFGLDNQCYCDNQLAVRGFCTGDLPPVEGCRFNQYCDTGNGNINLGLQSCLGDYNSNNNCVATNNTRCDSCESITAVTYRGQKCTDDASCGAFPPSCVGNQTVQNKGAKCDIEIGTCIYSDNSVVSGNPLACSTAAQKPILPPPSELGENSYCNGYLSCRKGSTGEEFCGIYTGYCGYNPEANCLYSQNDSNGKPQCYAGVCQEGNNCGFNSGCKYNPVVSRDAIACPGTENFSSVGRNTPDFFNRCRDTYKYKSYQASCNINGDKLVNESDLRRIIENINKAKQTPPSTQQQSPQDVNQLQPPPQTQDQNSCSPPCGINEVCKNNECRLLEEGRSGKSGTATCFINSNKPNKGCPDGYTCKTEGRTNVPEIGVCVRK